MPLNKDDLVHTDFNSLYIHNLRNPFVPSFFVEKLNDLIYQGFNEIFLTVEDDYALPHVIVPVAGYIDFIKKHNLFDDVKIYGNLSNYIQGTYFQDPMSIKSQFGFFKKYPFDKVWKFHDMEDVFNVVTVLVDEINKVGKIAQGVSYGLEYCLNEIFDNVLQHSGIDEGCFMAQYISKTNTVYFSIFDSGYGIYNTLSSGTEYNPNTAIDAITLSVKENVTRDKNVGQGNGLFMLHNLIRNNKSRLSITTHDASYFFEKDEIKKGQWWLLNDKNQNRITDYGCTNISFAINLSNEIDVKESLGHEKIDLRLEALEDDDTGEIHFKLSERCETGFGTRRSGKRMRLDIINLITESKRKIRIDFSGVGVVSSSFADECIGRLVNEMGFMEFQRIISISNANENTEAIINKAVMKRIGEIKNAD